MEKEAILADGNRQFLPPAITLSKLHLILVGIPRRRTWLLQALSITQLILVRLLAEVSP